MQLASDIVWLPRVEETLVKRGRKAYARCLTPAEQVYCFEALTVSKQAARIGARLAAKESVAKALGVGLNGFGYTQGLRWREVEVLPAGQDKAGVAYGPQLALSGRAAELSQANGIKSWQLSLSHDGPVAQAVVLAI